MAKYAVMSNGWRYLMRRGGYTVIDLQSGETLAPWRLVVGDVLSHGVKVVEIVEVPDENTPKLSVWQRLSRA